MSEFNALLAEHQGLGNVRICGCNSIHLSIGPVTLCLAPEAFAQAAVMIQEAMTQLTEITAAKLDETPTIPGPHNSFLH